MTIKEKIFAQNWIEQFRDRRRAVLRGDYERTNGAWCDGTYDPFREELCCQAINRAFPWDESVQGIAVWSVRYDMTDANGSVRLVR